MDSGDDPDPDGRSAAARAATLVVAVLVLALGAWFLQQTTTHPLVGFVGAMLDAAVAVVSGTVYQSTIERFLSPVVRFLSAIRPYLNPVRGFAALGPRRKPIMVASAVVLLVVVGVTLSLRLRGTTNEALGCQHPAELRILTSTDSLEPTRDLVNTYERWTADRNHDCPAVHPFVYSAPASLATGALANSWKSDGTKDPLISIGPRPDVWLPDSTVDVRAVVDVAQEAQLPRPIRTSASIGSSPMVIASRAPLPGVPTTNPTWSEAVSSVLNPQAGLLAPDPQTSTTGLFAMASYLRGKSGPVEAAEARRREQTVSASGGVAREDSVALLCRFGRDVGRPATVNPALVTSEQLWQRYREGGLLGDSCPGTLPAPGNGSAVMPVDTPVLDHPFVQFTWSTEKQRSGGSEFYRWLTESTAGTTAVKAVHLQRARPDCSILTGTLATNPCVSTDLDAMLDIYHAAQQPGLVLLAVDASGSMADPVRVKGPSRFTVASAAVVQSLGQIGPEDRFGLWVFPAAAGASGELLKIGVGDAAHREQVAKTLATVHPQGSTPLYKTIIGGLENAAAARTSGQVGALVVLTDGQDTSSGMTAENAGQQIADISQTTGVRLFIVATGEATCEGTQNLRKLTDAGRGQCYEADLDQIAGTTAELFESLWKGQ